MLNVDARLFINPPSSRAETETKSSNFHVQKEGDLSGSGSAWEKQIVMISP